VTAKDPYWEDVECCYGLIYHGLTAVIEMAACAGLPLVGNNLQPEKATTFGVGQLMVDTVHKRCKK
jgi:glycerate kinase